MLTLSAAETVGKNLNSGATVLLESTVYPGVTEEVVAPINFRTRIKDELQYCIDFYIGYSPERINPGDEAHEAKELGYLIYHPQVILSGQAI